MQALWTWTLGAPGSHRTLVGQVERGRRNIGLHNLLKLAEALEIDPSGLITGLRLRPRALPTGSS